MSDKQVLVALGASAGGMEALSEFIKPLEPGFGCAYVVVQHLSPDNSSLLTELLSRQTMLPVEVIDTQVTPLPDHIYITPPNHDVVYELKSLVLKEPAEKIGPKPSVNRMLHSMASANDIFPVGVILSGTGTDGASGLAAIKSAGGLTLAQEPSSSKYNGMPLASISAEAVDHIYEPAEMAKELPHLLRSGIEQGKRHTEHNAYFRIISVARGHSGLDLTHYKPATIERRIDRRMHETHCPTMGSYADYLTSHPEEIDAFIRDVLIPVTEFFRDPECFDALKKELESLLQNFSHAEVFRAWVAGCATGEEAYSIAFLLEEINRQRDIPLRYQIFATDLDERALTVARQGMYPMENLKSLPDEIVQRYFIVTDKEARVAAQVRDQITFSKHNLIQDPPFSRLHLISCRNLLIYFNNMLQKHVYELFHYALGKDGLLFLGKSESISDSNLFITVNSKNRIYLSNNLAKAVRSLPFMHFTSELPAPKKAVSVTESPTVDLERLAYKAVSRQMAAIMMVVDSQDQVVFVSDAARSYLCFKSDRPSLLVHELVSQSLRAEMKAQLFKVRRNREASVSGFHSVNLDGEECMIRIQVFPLAPNNFEQIVVVLVKQSADEIFVSSNLEETNDDQTLLINQLQHELNATGESLQTVIEELETSNEELQATNEELQSTNEELQSANEELQTTNEELQSTNEELLTVNDEMLQKNQQLEHFNNEFENLYQSSGIPYLILDRELHIVRLHRDLETLLAGNVPQIGAHASSLNWRTTIPQLAELLGKTIATGGTYETSLFHNRHHYRIEIRPYLVNRKEIAGAVLSFVDISELQEKQQALDATNQELEDILDVSPDGIIAIDEVGTIVNCSRTGAEMFGYSQEELLEKPVGILMPDEVAKEHATYLERYRKTGTPHIIGVPRRVVARHHDGHLVPVELHIAEFENPRTRMRYIGVLRNISQLVKMESMLKEHQLNASVTLDNIDDGVIRLDENWHILYANKESLRLIGDKKCVGKPLVDVFQLLKEGSCVPINYHELDLQDKRSHLGVIHMGDEHRLIEFRLYRLDVDEVGDRQLVMVFHDVTQQELVARKLDWESRHDPLTGLLNRKELLSHLDRLLGRLQQHSRSHVLLFIDLDQFKVVNDSSGHQAGDELLRQLSVEMAGFIRSRDMLARLGGDEFALLLENCPMERAEHIANNLIKLIREFRFVYQDKLYRIGASVGIAMLTERQTPEQILASADHACYAAKELGRNQYAIADPGGEVDKVRDLLHIQNITDALESNAFEFYFQPIVSTREEQNQPYWELLIRMRGPAAKLIPPGTFIPIAERYNYMHHIDNWVIDHLTMLMKQLTNKLGAENMPMVAINISGQSISHSGMKDRLLNSLQSIGITLQNFCIEITETAAITNFGNTLSLLRELHKQGCHIALDDFGSGMASFSYIRQLPIDTIKIDSHIVKDIENDLLDMTIVQSIQHIAEVLDCKTVAEGVDRATNDKRLRSIGVDFLQGNFISEPINLASWLQTMNLDITELDLDFVQVISNEHTERDDVLD